MPVHEFAGDEIRRLDHTTFNSTQLQERRDLQRLRRANIGVIATKIVVIFEEFDHWDDSRRRIDLLSIDQKAKSVVTELKRTEDGADVELQLDISTAILPQRSCIAPSSSAQPANNP